MSAQKYASRRSECRVPAPASPSHQYILIPVDQVVRSFAWKGSIKVSASPPPAKPPSRSLLGTLSRLIPTRSPGQPTNNTSTIAEGEADGTKHDDMPEEVEKEKSNEPIDVDAEVEVEGKDEKDEVVVVDAGEEGEAGKEEEEGEDEDEEDDGEGEFEVETILDHKNSNGKFTYLVSWRGYGPEHNTWEPQEHVEHAQDVVTAYWNTRPKTNSKQTAKRGRPSSTPQPSKSVKTAKTSNGGRRGRGSKSARQADDDEFDDDVPEFEATHVDSMDNYEDVRDWEELVKTVDTIEKTSDGLVVYMTMIGGERVGQSTEVAYKRCPQKILKFYESHLKWKMATD